MAPCERSRSWHHPVRIFDAIDGDQAVTQGGAADTDAKAGALRQCAGAGTRVRKHARDEVEEQRRLVVLIFKKRTRRQVRAEMQTVGVGDRAARIVRRTSDAKAGGE